MEHDDRMARRRRGRAAAGDPKRDLIESGSLRGRRAVTLGMVQALKEDAASLARGLAHIEGIAGMFARDRARTIERTLQVLERVARLPADPSTDYMAGGAAQDAGAVSTNPVLPPNVNNSTFS